MTPTGPCKHEGLISDSTPLRRLTVAEPEICAVCGLEVRLASVRLRDLPATAWLHREEPAGHAAVLGTRAPADAVASSHRLWTERQDVIVAAKLDTTIPPPSVEARRVDPQTFDGAPSRLVGLAKTCRRLRWECVVTYAVGPWLDSKGGYTSNAETLILRARSTSGAILVATWLLRPDLKDNRWKFEDAIAHPGGDLVAGKLGGNDLTAFVKEHTP